MRLRIAEIDQQAVAEIAGDVAAEVGDDAVNRVSISDDDLGQILGIQFVRQRHRVDEIAEHHRDLPSLGASVENFGIVAAGMLPR